MNYQFYTMKLFVGKPFLMYLEFVILYGKCYTLLLLWVDLLFFFFFLLDFRISGADLNGNECSEMMWPHSKNIKLAENQPTVWNEPFVLLMNILFMISAVCSSYMPYILEYKQQTKEYVK